MMTASQRMFLLHHSMTRSGKSAKSHIPCLSRDTTSSMPMVHLKIVVRRFFSNVGFFSQIFVVAIMDV